MAKKISRRAAVKSLTLVPILSHFGPEGLFASNAHTHPRVPVQSLSEPWQPEFLTTEQSETIALLAEYIIPETETPGARAAKVHQHIDFVLSNEPGETQKQFRDGLGWLEERSRELFGTSFNQSTPEQHTALLTLMSSPTNQNGRDETGKHFFQNMKYRTVFAYYTSEIGLIQELEYSGNTYLAEFPACEHPEHLNWKPGSE